MVSYSQIIISDQNKICSIAKTTYVICEQLQFDLIN